MKNEQVEKEKEVYRFTITQHLQKSLGFIICSKYTFKNRMSEDKAVRDYA